MQEKIGDTWFYVVAVPRQYRDPVPSYEIKTAKVIGETPRKWILRASTDEYDAPPGNHPFYDFSIFKTGPLTREGRNQRKRTETFFATEDLAKVEISQRLALRWVEGHNYRIGERVKRLSDPVLLKKIADLIGYREDQL